MFDISSCYGLFASEKDKAYFWSGLGKNGETVSSEIAARNDGITLEMLMHENKDKLIDAGFDYDKDLDRFLFSAENYSDWESISNAFAEQASGEVHVVLGDQVREDGVWNTTEFPTLSENGNVTKVTSVDPVTGKDKDVLLDRTNSIASSREQYFSYGISSNNIASIGGGGARAPDCKDTSVFPSGACKEDLPPIQPPHNNSSSAAGPEKLSSINQAVSESSNAASNAAESGQNAAKSLSGGMV